MKSMIAALGCVLGVGALFGALAFSESRDVAQPLPLEQRFPEVCEQYVSAFEACNADALKVSARLASNGRTGDEDAIYIQRQLNQLRRELFQIRSEAGDMALISYCTEPQFEDINYRLVHQIAASLLEANAMGRVCASAVGDVIQRHGDPMGKQLEILDAMESSNTTARITVVPHHPQRR